MLIQEQSQAGRRAFAQALPRCLHAIMGLNVLICAKKAWHGDPSEQPDMLLSDDPKVTMVLDRCAPFFQLINILQNSRQWK